MSSDLKVDGARPGEQGLHVDHIWPGTYDLIVENHIPINLISNPAVYLSYLPLWT